MKLRNRELVCVDDATGNVTPVTEAFWRLNPQPSGRIMFRRSQERRCMADGDLLDMLYPNRREPEGES